MLGAGFGQACEFSVGGGNEDDIGGGLAEVYGFIVVDCARLGVQEMHVVGAFVWTL